MASNQLSNKPGKSDGRHAQTGRHPDSLSQSQQFGSRREDAEEEAGYLAQGASQFREMTRDHEGTAVIVALAAGFGIGLAIGSALGATHQRPKTWRERLNAEGIGRHMLDRLEGMIPDALTEYIHK